MQETFQSNGIVLDKYESGDYDNTYRVLTESFGIIDLFAKSSRKNSAKLAANMEPGSLSRIFFVPRKTDQMMLIGASLLWKPPFIKQTPRKNELISQALSYTKKIFYEEQAAMRQWETQKPYENLKKYLLGLNDAGEDEARAMLYHSAYHLKLLEIGGFAPLLKHCLVCGKAVSAAEDMYYSQREGGIICRICAKKQAGSVRVSANGIKLANYLMEKPLAQIRKLSIEPKVTSEAWRLVENHLQYCLG